MGLFWDLIQQSQISDQRGALGTMEDRLAVLERELAETRLVLHEVLVRLENKLGSDLDADGRIG